MHKLLGFWNYGATFWFHIFHFSYRPTTTLSKLNTKLWFFSAWILCKSIIFNVYKWATTCRMCLSSVTLRRPPSQLTVKLSRPPAAPSPVFNHCLSRRSSAQGGLSSRDFPPAVPPVLQTDWGQHQRMQSGWSSVCRATILSINRNSFGEFTDDCPDLPPPQPAGSQSGWPGQPRCMRSPRGSPSHWPRWWDPVWQEGQSGACWTGLGRARVGRGEKLCWRTAPQKKSLKSV